MLVAVNDKNTRLQDMTEESDALLSSFYYRMLKLKEDRPNQAALDMLRRARAALETRSYKDAVRQVSSFSRVARDAIHSSEESAAAFKAMEKSLEQLRVFAERGIDL